MSLLQTLNTSIWRIIAAIVSTERVGDWLIKRALRTPYTHIMSVDGKDTYMGRWWLFNPYPASGEAKRFGWGWLPSVRIHHIMREDDDRHLHDHPGDLRQVQGNVSPHRAERDPGDHALTA